MSADLKSSARRVQDALAAQGFAFEVKEFPESTRTSAEAAAAIGCAVGEIAKSLVFRGAESGEAVLIVASGANRVDPAKAATLLGEAIKRADADFVRTETGFAIGGVPPVGHDRPLATLIDQDLMVFERIWAAAGTPNAVFPLSPQDLSRLTGGTVGDLKQD